jgi:hypothetical protein
MLRALLLWLGPPLACGPKPAALAADRCWARRGLQSSQSSSPQSHLGFRPRLRAGSASGSPAALAAEVRFDTGTFTIMALHNHGPALATASARATASALRCPELNKCDYLPATCPFRPDILPLLVELHLALERL